GRARALHRDVVHHLPGAAADAGAADRPDRHLRDQRVRPDPDPGTGRGRPARADEPVRRLLLHELHGHDHRVRRAPAPLHRAAAPRMGVVFAVSLTVIGWAYGFGSLLTLVQDRPFRQALALQRFTRTGARLREPFLLMVGFGQTGRMLAERLDLIGRRLVVLD